MITAADSIQNARPTQFSATVVKARVPTRIGKRIFRDPTTGRIAKIPGGNLINGTALRVRCDLNTLARAVTETHPDWALILGVHQAPDDEAVILTDAAATPTARKANPQIIARTKKDFCWPQGAGLLLIDTDTPKVAARAPLTRTEVLRELLALCPELKKAPRVLYDSSGGYIYDFITGAELVGQRGVHHLFVIADASHAAEAAKVLQLRAIVKGRAWIEVGKAGQLLVRSIIDVAAASSPERLVFAFGAECDAGLEQRRPAPEVCNVAAEPFDSRRYLKLTKQLQQKADGALRNMIADPAIKAEQARMRILWENEQIAKQVAKLAADRAVRGLPMLTVDEEEQVRAQLHQQHLHTAASMTCSTKASSADLPADHLILLADGTTVTVAQIRADPEWYDNLQCHDPLEPDYNNHDRRIGTIHTKPKGGGIPFIYSHAHGGCKYWLSGVASVFSKLA